MHVVGAGTAGRELEAASVISAAAPVCRYRSEAERATARCAHLEKDYAVIKAQHRHQPHTALSSSLTTANDR